MKDERMDAKQKLKSNQKIHLILLFVAISIALSGALSGCNFFGKKEDENANLTPGTLANGTNIVGSWVALGAGTTTTYDPVDALTIVYTFDPNSSAKMEVRDPHRTGASCTGFGQYRAAGDDVFLYIQSVSPSNCPFGFSSFTHLGAVESKEQSLVVRSPNGSTFSYLAARSVQFAPTGVWSFGGAGGLDWLIVDKSGYFILQLSEGTGPGRSLYLYVGYYRMHTNGAFELVLIEDMDPTRPLSQSIYFEQFVTDGSTLQLYETLQPDSSVFTGTKL